MAAAADVTGSGSATRSLNRQRRRRREEKEEGAREGGEKETRGNG